MNIKVYRIVGISILLTIFLSSFAFPQNQPKAWYVYKYATGLNNGTSWTNAWTSFASINWNNILGGDTLYISGGADSLVYNGTLTIGKSGLANKLITITKGLDSGHNGRAIIDGIDGSLKGVDIGGYKYLKISKLEIKRVKKGISINNGAKVIILDSLIIKDNYDQAGIYANGWTADNSYSIDSLIIQYCVITNFDYSTQNDNSYFLGVNNLIIEGCTFINYNLVSSNNEDYSDNIQTQNVGNCIIRNNILINYAGNGDQGIIGNFTNNASTGDTSLVYIYNNVIIYPNPSASNARCILIRYYDWYISAGLPNIFIYSNTLYGALNVTGVALQLPAFVKNNIINTTNSYCIVQDNMATNSSVNNVVGNLMYKIDGGTFIGGTWKGISGNSATNPSYNTWINTLGGSPIITSNPLFNDISNLDFTLRSNSPAIDTGTNLGSPFNVDIIGTSRPQGSAYDIGAYEFYEGQSSDNTPPVVISASILDSITIRVIFSEPLENSGAANPANYQIDNGITVNNVELISNSVIELNTTIHSPGFYTVTVNNVTDTAGNVISSQNNTANYGYNPDPLPGLLKFTPSGVLASSIPEPQHLPEKTFDGLGYNSGDPASRWAAQGLPQWIVYDLGDIKMLNKTRIQYFRWLEGRIYTYSILSSVDSINWIILRQNIQSQNVEWNEENFEPIPARYVKILVTGNNESDWANIWETEIYGQFIVSGNEDDNLKPDNFSLEQNYPNPFNPVTKIRYTIPGNVEARRGVSLRVYDILGNEVATLVDEYKEPGIYEVEFDAADLASGVYIYRLQADGYLNTRKMILLR